MKKFLCVLISALMIISTSAALFSYAESGSVTVSDADELKAAILSAEDNSVIRLHSGRYIFDSTFRIENIEKNITIESCEGETAVFTSAFAVKGWESCTVNGVSALCADADGRTITSLFAEEKPLQAARLPETGFYYIDNVDLTDTVGEDDWMGTNGIYVSDIDYELESPEDICVSTVHWWVNELSPMVSFDASTGLIKTEKYSGMSNHKGDRYFLENVKESLDKPGEWCFDSSEDKIFYVPKDGESAENLALFAASEAEMMKINNCSGITFKNIEFAETAFAYGDEKFINTDIHTHNRYWQSGSYQSAVEACGAVTVTYSDSINFVNCRFSNTGCTALKFFDGAKHCKAENCLFDSVGASAIFIGGKYSFYDFESNKQENYAEDITVTNCEIQNYGQKFFGASGITLAYCDTAEISHNEIHNGYYTGISVGFTWLFFDNPTQYISVKDNLIHDIGNNMISDLGGIYLLGVQQGTVVSGNVIHDVTCYDGESGYAGNGIYLDSGCEFMTIENNLVFNCDTSCFNTTLSRNNIIRNNIFAFSGQSVACLGTAAYAQAFLNLNSTYENNIFLTDEKIVSVEYMQNPDHFTGKGNIIWDISNGDELYFCTGHTNGKAIIRQTAEKEGLLSSAVFADPGFVNAAGYDFTFKEDSYAVQNGFVPFDYDTAGTLEGTVIGFDIEGGKTEYNENTKPTRREQTKVKFFEKIKLFFYKIFDLLKNLFK